MTARIANLSSMHSFANEALGTLGSRASEYGIDAAVLELTHLRASQINGCAWCLEYGLKGAAKAGLSNSQVIQVAGWRDSELYSPAERAALDLAEHITRIGDRSDPVPDAVWAEAARHFDDSQLAGLVLWVATTNAYNRINVATRRVPGTW